MPVAGETPIVFQAGGRILPLSAYPGELPVMTESLVANRSSGEPTIGVNARGAALYPSIKFDGPAGFPKTLVYVTKDNGTTWSDRTPTVGNMVASDPTSEDPYVYADPVTGRIFNLDLYIGCSNMQYSDDDGMTWVTNPITCGIPVNDHQTLAAGPAVPPLVSNPVFPRVLYYCVNQLAGSTCTHSLDGGLTWLDPAQAFGGPQASGESGPHVDQCGGLNGHVYASEKSGTVFLPAGCGVAEVARSTDNGVTWTDIVVDKTVGFDGHDGSVAADANGTVYYFWLDGRTLPRLSVSHDDGLSWGPALNVTAPGVTTAKYPAITAGLGGRVAFLYVGSTVTHGAAYDAGCRDPPLCTQGAKYPAELHNATWNGYITFSLDASSPNATFATVMANSAADPLARGYCSGRCYKSGGNGMFDFLDIETQPVTGQVWASLVDLCTDKCASPSGTDKDIADSRGAAGIQVGGTPLGSRFPS
jgi:hypothetical protein